MVDPIPPRRRRSRPAPSRSDDNLGLLSKTDFTKPLHPDSARTLAAGTYRTLRIVLVVVVVLELVLAAALPSVVVLLQAVVTALIGVTLLGALRVLLEAALTMIADSFDDREFEHDQRYGAGRHG